MYLFDLWVFRTADDASTKFPRVRSDGKLSCLGSARLNKSGVLHQSPEAVARLHHVISGCVVVQLPESSPEPKWGHERYSFLPYPTTNGAVLQKKNPRA